MNGIFYDWLSRKHAAAGVSLINLLASLSLLPCPPFKLWNRLLNWLSATQLRVPWRHFSNPILKLIWGFPGKGFLPAHHYHHHHRRRGAKGEKWRARPSISTGIKAKSIDPGKRGLHAKSNTSSRQKPILGRTNLPPGRLSPYRASIVGLWDTCFRQGWLVLSLNRFKFTLLMTCRPAQAVKGNHFVAQVPEIRKFKFNVFESFFLSQIKLQLLKVLYYSDFNKLCLFN